MKILKFWQEKTLATKALALILPLFLLRVLFSANVGLGDDEAYYWVWSKDLALSYFDHPGFVAWAIAASTRLFGDTELAVRLPSLLSFLVILAVGVRLSLELFDEMTAIFVGLLLFFSPLWGIGGLLMTPEPVFMVFWALACWVFWQRVREDQPPWTLRKTWLWLGLLMGLGLNAKLSMALLAPGFGLYLLLSPKNRRDLLSPWPWLGVVVTALVCLPIFVWNQQFDWPSFKFQLQTRHEGGSLSLARWASWWAAQVLLLGPVAFVLMMLSFAQGWWQRRSARWRFLVCLALPTFVTFAWQSLFASFKVHWAGPAYFLLAMGAGAIWSQGLLVHHRPWVKARSRAWMKANLGFLLPLNLLLFSFFATPWLPKLHRELQLSAPWQTLWDPANEFSGWKELGQQALTRQREIHAETGRKPFLAAHRYETVAQVQWGTREHVVQLSPQASHFTLAQNLRHELEHLRGRDALFISSEKYSRKPLDVAKFEDCRPEEFRTFRQGEHARTFTLWHCRNFQANIR